MTNLWSGNKNEHSRAASSNPNNSTATHRQKSERARGPFSELRQVSRQQGWKYQHHHTSYCEKTHENAVFRDILPSYYYYYLFQITNMGSLWLYDNPWIISLFFYCVFFPCVKTYSSNFSILYFVYVYQSHVSSCTPVNFTAVQWGWILLQVLSYACLYAS